MDGPKDDLKIQLACNFEGLNEKLIDSNLAAMMEIHACHGKRDKYEYLNN